MKKQRNWLGYIFIALYILIFILLLISGLFLYNIGKIDIGKFLYSASILWLVVMLPVTWVMVNNFRLKMLPNKKISAKVVQKGTISSIRHVGKTVSNKINPTITFELSDGRLSTFIVPIDLFNYVFENESGILVYKEQGKYIYFVNFERQQ